MKKTLENFAQRSSVYRMIFLTAILVTFLLVSCSDDDDASDSTDDMVELTPDGPDPEWGPTITDPMLVVVEEYQSYNIPPLQTLTPAEVREKPTPADAAMAVIEEYNLPLPASTVDTMGISIPVEGGSIHSRVYTPGTGRDSYPVIVYYHGGGWVIAGIDTYNSSAEALANQTDAIVVSVGYRQAPEFKFPTAHNDSYAAYQWVLENAESFNGDPQKVAVVGESAGGNLAASVSLLAKSNDIQLPVHEALIYPIADHDFSTESYQEYQTSLFLNAPLMQWFFDYYLNDPSEGSDPRIALVDADLSGMPSTTIIGAEIDPLQSEGKQLADNLEDAGVETTYRLYTGVTHEFFGMAAILPEAMDAQTVVVNNLKDAFED